MAKPQVMVAVRDRNAMPDALSLLERSADPIYVTTADEFRSASKNCSILLQWQFDSSLLAQCGPGGLKWVHTNSVGVNSIATAEVASADLTVTNTRGVFERPMAEFVLAGILFHVKDLRRTIEDQRARVWNHRAVATIKGRKVVVVGAGGVGGRIVDLLRRAGLEVSIVGRTQRTEGELGLVHSITDLHGLLAEADDVVLAAPLTDTTRGLLGRQELAAMKPGAHLVNVGRGALVDETALVEALQAGHIAAATLDVFESEPLDSDHPFWGMDNVVVSPHMSGDVVGWEYPSIELFLRNLDLWSRGEPLANQVDISAFAIGSSAST